MPEDKLSVDNDNGDTAGTTQNTKPPPLDSPLLSRYSRRAGLWVCAMSVFFVIGMLLLTWWQVSLWKADEGVPSLNLADCKTSLCVQSVLEYELLSNRSNNTLDFLISRHVIAISAEIISLAFAVLGAVLIFDRIESNEKGEIGTGEKGGWFSVSSTFPGVLVCAMGMIALIYSLWHAERSAYSLMVRDVPGYFLDLNYERNVRNRGALIANVNKNREEAAKAQANFNPLNEAGAVVVPYEPSVLPETNAQSDE